MPIHWLIVRMPSATFLRLLLKLANVPSAPQISLPSRSGHISPSAAIFLAQFRSLSKDFSSFCTSATAVVELCSPCGEVPWNIVAISLRVLASSRATTLRVSVLNIWVFSQTHEAVFGILKCNICRNLHLKPFHSRLEVFERESFIFPYHAPEISAAFRESATWGSVAAERDLWLNLTEIREKEKVFLLDAPYLNLGCLEAVNSVVEKFRSAKSQSAGLRQFMPRRTRNPSNTPSSSLSREHSLPRKETTSLWVRSLSLGA